MSVNLNSKCPTPKPDARAFGQLAVAQAMSALKTPIR
jgi:hypothetical protein